MARYILWKSLNKICRVFEQNTVEHDKQIHKYVYFLQCLYTFIHNLRNRKHFPCFYRGIETRVEVWEKREIAWEHEHEVRVFPRNFELLPNFHKCFYNSITEGTFVCACAGRYKRVVHESRDCRGNPNIGGNFKVQFVNKLFQTWDICHTPNF